MSVNPGFGGQKFIGTMVDKLRRLKEMIFARGFSTRIEIDGGIDAENVGEIAAAGADIVVAGSAVFGKGDPAEAVKSLLESGAVWV
jgi:ribulose-phosphate 3-epimerase